MQVLERYDWRIFICSPMAHVDGKRGPRAIMTDM
jgi:hypothetical protein